MSAALKKRRINIINSSMCVCVWCGCVLRGVVNADTQAESCSHSKANLGSERTWYESNQKFRTPKVVSERVRRWGKWVGHLGIQWGYELPSSFPLPRFSSSSSASSSPSLPSPPFHSLSHAGWVDKGTRAGCPGGREALAQCSRQTARQVNPAHNQSLQDRSKVNQPRSRSEMPKRKINPLFDNTTFSLLDPARPSILSFSSFFPFFPLFPFAATSLPFPFTSPFARASASRLLPPEWPRVVQARSHKAPRTRGGCSRGAFVQIGCDWPFSAMGRGGVCLGRLLPAFPLGIRA